ncbi:hypothetical protein [Pseudooctadecabacter sp.]|uniref:hypothetical protein n=1 Tax=Pseudooctadecabacter sp. TaxID=1966338 RepID=UPI003F6B6704
MKDVQQTVFGCILALCLAFKLIDPILVLPHNLPFISGGLNIPLFDLCQNNNFGYDFM